MQRATGILGPVILSTMLVGLLPAPGGAAQERLPGVEQAPIPEWVTEVGFDHRIQVPEEWLVGGLHDLLMDLQIRGGTQPEEHYFHFARRILNEQGVDDAAQVSVSFDPSCEVVLLHDIAVHRDGEVLPRLDLSLARLIEPEQRRDQQIFDGRRTVLLFLPDVRVGDTVEARYTIRGANPVFGGRFAAAFYTAQYVPLERLHCRAVVPRVLPVRWKHHQGDLEPTVRDLDDEREYVWRDQQIAPVSLEDGLPDWYDPVPWVQLSEYRSWNEVADWATDLFRLPQRMPRSIGDHVRRIQAEGGTLHQQALAALRFVQDEVRYLGLQFGTGSFQPSPITDVLARRYGDCKDKTLLTVALLKGLGIRAEAALVNTVLGEHFGDLLPTHHAFDHVIVRAEVGGKVLWLDPTQSRQGGTLDSLAVPDLGAALVLGGGSEEVCQRIPRPPRDDAGVRVVRTLDVRAGIEPVPFTVETVYLGNDADLVRRELHRSSAHELQRMYLSFYESAWPTILPAGELVLEDDRERNEVRIVEEYSIPGFWKHHDRIRERGDVPALEMGMLVPGTVQGSRGMPLALPATSMDCTTLLRMDEGWQLDSEASTVDNRFLRAAFTAEYEHGWLELRHTLRPLADHIPAQACADGLRDLEPFRESLQYQLIRRKRGQGFQEEVADR